MGFLCGPGRQPFGFLFFYCGEAAIFAGVGHWLHDPPPIFFRPDNACPRPWFLCAMTDISQWYQWLLETKNLLFEGNDQTGLEEKP
jgi:hypothetical protein